MDSSCLVLAADMVHSVVHDIVVAVVEVAAAVVYPNSILLSLHSHSKYVRWSGLLFQPILVVTDCVADVGIVDVP